MSENKDYARGKCPICGTDAFFRINKNGILYTFCRNSHHLKMGKYDSKEAIEAIEGGKSWHNGVMHLYPLNHVQHQEMKGTAENGNNGITERRATVDAGANTANETTGTDKPAKRSVDVGFW